jgi:serine/threonine protein kinase
MTPCPSDDNLALLLADTLTVAERKSVAVHVEQCELCQKKLAALTEVHGAPLWRPDGQDSALSKAERQIFNRLKQARRLAAQRPPGPAEPTIASRAVRAAATPVENASGWPTVPGYEIVGVLGRGGMADVYKAKQLELKRIVAVKMLRDWAGAGEKQLARFRAEADVIANLQHPNIVQIYDVGEVDGRPYFVLEYVAGGNLAQCLNGTPQVPRLASQFIELLARAVQAAHASGVIHRDLKPANILLIPPQQESIDDDRSQDTKALVKDGDMLTCIPKIADFGVAKRAHGDWDVQLQRTLTVTGDLLGTPSYMAPEQAAPSGPPIGPGADIYALGAILYELLTGRPPFKGATPLDTVLQVMHNEPVSVTDLQPNVPRDLETICLKCLQKEPRRRYESASELANDLHSFLRGEPIQARPSGAFEKVWRWIRKHPVPSGLVAAGILTPIVALFILSLLSARLVRSSALDSAAQQAEVLEEANNQYSLIVQRVEQAHYPVNKMYPPTPDTVPLSIPATFLHDVGKGLQMDTKTGIEVRQFSDYPFPWRLDGGPHDDFEREALLRLRKSNGKETVYDFTEIDGEPVVRYAQARMMKQSCVDCHNTHPFSSRKDWKVGDVRGVLEIIRPLKNDEARVTQALRLTLLLSGIGSGLLLLGSVLAVWATRWRRGLGV